MGELEAGCLEVFGQGEGVQSSGERVQPREKRPMTHSEGDVGQELQLGAEQGRTLREEREGFLGCL